MTNRKLAILGLLAVIMAGWAILQHRLSGPGRTEGLFQSVPLIQGLDIDAIAQIKMLADKGETSIILNKQDGQFVVMDKDGYPANVSTINTLLNSCLDIRVAERITSNPDNHADLGVTDETARYAVRFFIADGDLITGVLISEQQEEDPQGAHVRLATRDDTYFITSPPWLTATAMGYINATLVEAKRDEIRKVTVSGPEGSYTLMSAGGSGPIMLDPMPEEKQFKETTYQTVFGTLSSLRCDDVMAAENAPDGLTYDHSYVCELENSTVYTVRLAKDEDKTFATLTAEFKDSSPVQISRTESEEELKIKEAKLLAMDAVKAFTDRHKGWVYVIPSYKSGDLVKPLNELLEDKPKPAEPNAVEPEETAQSTETEQT